MGVMGKTKWLAGASAAMFLASAVHGQLLYNEKLDNQAKAALAEYAAMRDAHLNLLKERQASVTALSKRVDEAAIAAIQAERDREIVRILAVPEAGGNSNGRKLELSHLIDQRIRHVAGVDPNELKSLQGPGAALLGMAGIRVSGLQEEAFTPSIAPVLDEAVAARQMDELHKYFGGRNDGHFTYAKYCEEAVPDLQGLSGPDQDSRIAAFLDSQALKDVPAANRYSASLRLIMQVCPPVHFAKRQKELRKSLEGDGRLLALKALAGIGLSHAEAAQAGSEPAIDLGLSIQDLRPALEVAAQEVKKSQRELKQLKDEQKKLEEALKKGIVADIQSAAANIVAIVGKAPEESTGPPPALSGGPSIASAQADAGVDDCLYKVTLACARQLAETLGLASFAKARESALFEIAALLADPKQRAEAAQQNCGSPASGIDETQAARATRVCLTQSAMALLGVADRASHIQAGRPGELAALAIRIADAQMRVGTAEARAAALTRRIDNLAMQRAALVSELNILFQARKNLDRDSDYRIALLNYARSVDQGRMAYERTGEQFTLIALDEFAVREQQIVRGRYAVIDGLLATITSSTAAGIKPSELAGFLSALGITTLGIAKAAQ